MSQTQQHLEAMIGYLHDDPLLDANPQILRFLLKEWPGFQQSMHLTTTMDNVKKRLLQMRVRYIQFRDNQDWLYWTDYTQTGIFAFHDAPHTMATDMTVMPDPETSETTDVQNVMETPHPHTSTTTELADTSIDTEDILLATDTTRPPHSATSTPRNPTSQISVAWTGELHRMRDHNTTDSPHLDSENSDDVSSQLLTPRESPTTKTYPSHANPTSPIQKMTSLHMTDVIDLSSPESTIAMAEHDPHDGFITVQHRSNSAKRRSIQTTLPWSTPKSDGKPKATSRPATVIAPANITRTPLAPLQRIQVDTFTDILHERMQAVETSIRTHEQQGLQRTSVTLTEHTLEINRLFDERELRMEQMWNDRERISIEKQEQRMTAWQVRQTADEARLARLSAESRESEAHSADMHTRAKRTLRSWIEVATNKFKDDLDGYRAAYNERTKDFCDDHMQQLEAYLDGYQANARVVQAELLVRLKDDVAAAYDELRQHQADTTLRQRIPPDDDVPSGQPTPAESTTNNAPPHDDTPAAPPGHPPKRRWADEVYDRFQHPAAHSQIPASYTHPAMMSHSPRSRTGHYPHSSGPNTTLSHSEIDLQLSRFPRKANTPTHLRGRERNAVTTFYNAFVDFSKIYRIPFKILDDIRIDKLDDITQERLHPEDLLHDPVLYNSYSSAIYARLEIETVLDPSDKLYQGLLLMYNSKRDGYRLLQRPSGDHPHRPRAEHWTAQHAANGVQRHHTLRLRVPTERVLRHSGTAWQDVYYSREIHNVSPKYALGTIAHTSGHAIDARFEANPRRYTPSGTIDVSTQPTIDTPDHGGNHEH